MATSEDQQVTTSGDIHLAIDMSEQSCDEVQEILDMFDKLRFYYGQLADPPGIDQHAVTFQGFDGNHEGAQLAYLRYLWEDRRFTSLQPNATDQGNSHGRSLDAYRRMLQAWNHSANKYELTKEDIARITAARRYPGRA